MGHASIPIGILLIVVLIVWLSRVSKRCPTFRSACVQCIELVALAAAIVAVLYTYIVGVFMISARSMYPTLHPEDRIVVNKLVYRFHAPRFGDVIVFAAPPAIRDEEGQDFVKRVIGVPGDMIEIKDGKVFRNGHPLSEPYLDAPTADRMFPVRVPRNNLYVLGDNRLRSYDSRDWGFLDTKLVIGRATIIVSPAKRLGYVQ